VVITNGHYAVPHIAAIPGLFVWEKIYPATITHSKYFHNAQGFSKKRVVVVGSSASGFDLASQLTAVCGLPVYQYQKSVSELAVGSDSNISRMSEIVGVIVGERRVVFKNGEEVENVDAIVFCTGYFYFTTISYLVAPRPH
jgi:lysine/ornithine N-monooxygenase